MKFKLIDKQEGTELTSGFVINPNGDAYLVIGDYEESTLQYASTNRYQLVRVDEDMNSLCQVCLYYPCACDVSGKL